MVVALAVAVVMAFGGGSADAANVKCGDTITTDTTLHKDLVNCPNDGLLIGADDVTLDLNGHTIDGDGAIDKSCNPFTDFCDFGVGFDGYDNVTVEHGKVRQFEAGVAGFDARHVRYLDLHASSNTFSDLFLAGALRSLIRNCSGNGTTDAEGEGIGLFDSRHLRLLNSTFRRNAHAGIKPIGTKDSVIKGNVVRHNGDEGLLMEGGRDIRISHNRLGRNGGGITLGPGTHIRVTRNHVSRGRDGIRIEDGRGNLVAHNVVSRTRHAGILLGIPHPLLGGAHNRIRDNVVRRSREDGYRVGKKDRHSVLKGNVARRSGDDGFDVDSHSARLNDNGAFRNHDLGIGAVRGVEDGGGNVARHNGDPRQCHNIVCS